jgi:glyoxylase-like metal-dependent hydrolase (beta-lactamase superfamily II)
MASLERVAELAPRLALPGHGDPIDDPAGRAREIVEHHHDRLAETEAGLRDGPRTGYELSHVLFPGDLGAAGRRFAVAETLSHLERLVVEGRAVRAGDDGHVTYTQP